MLYRQITFAERYTVGLLRQRGLSAAAIARLLHRHRSTIGREVQRNRAHSDGTYRAQLADSYARSRRSRSRRNRQFTSADWAQVHELLREDWSPEQVAGWLRRFHLLSISHETIYRDIWADKHAGGTLYRHLRGASKQRRKRYGRYDSRGRLAGKRWITERPPSVESRTELGHWEADTMLGAGQAGACVLSMVERKSGYLLLGQLTQRTSAFVNARARQLIRAQPQPVQTITVDNGTEFHEYAKLERATGTRFYFATPHHAWERGTNENTNGLVRQYLPKRQSMAHLTQHDCNRIATKLNHRPRKRLGFRTPEECYAG
ncbi:MAG: IS30 family transposase [Gemmatimonadota bacterium]